MMWGNSGPTQIIVVRCPLFLPPHHHPNRPAAAVSLPSLETP